MTGIEGLLAAGGLPLVALGTGLEGDTVAMVAGALAHHRVIAAGFLPTALAAALGAFASDQTCFHLGRRVRGGPRLARIEGSAAARWLRAMLRRHPVLPLFLFRFVWGTRIAAPLAFGAGGVGAVRFVLLDAAACLTWGLLFVGLGFGLGAGIERAVGQIGPGRHLLLVAFGVAVLLVLVWAFTRMRRHRGG